MLIRGGLSSNGRRSTPCLFEGITPVFQPRRPWGFFFWGQARCVSASGIIEEVGGAVPGRAETHLWVTATPAGLKQPNGQWVDTPGSRRATGCCRPCAQYWCINLWVTSYQHCIASALSIVGFKRPSYTAAARAVREMNRINFAPI